MPSHPPEEGAESPLGVDKLTPEDYASTDPKPAALPLRFVAATPEPLFAVSDSLGRQANLAELVDHRALDGSAERVHGVMQDELNKQTENRVPVIG